MPSVNSFVIVVAAFAGTFQGIVWTISSLLGIIWHLAADYKGTVSYKSDNYETLLNSYLYEGFIRDRDRLPGLFIQPTTFFILLIIYFCFHLLWTITSVFLYLGGQNKLQKISNLKIGSVWIINSLLILILDVVTFSLLTHDYQFCIDGYNNLTNVDLKLPYLYSIIVYGIMMTLSARGYFLWLINLIIIGLIIQVWITYRSKLLIENQSRNLYGTIRPIRLPVVTIDRRSKDASKSQQTEMTNSETSTIGFFRQHTYNDNIGYVYDPEIEKRLSKYTVISN